MQGKGECASSCATSDGAEKAEEQGNASEKGKRERRKEVSTNILRRSLFAILCIRDVHFYAFTFTGWKATSYS